jgi:hypothetical protein
MARSRAEPASGVVDRTPEELGQLFRLAEEIVRRDRRPIIAEALQVVRWRISEVGYTQGCFNDLVTAGCDADELLWRVAMCSEGPPPSGDVVGEICGLEARELRSVPAQWSKVANQIQKIGAAPVGTLFEVAGVRDLSALPQALRNLGSLLALAGRLRWRTYWVIAKNRLRPTKDWRVP